MLVTTVNLANNTLTVVRAFGGSIAPHNAAAAQRPGRRSKRGLARLVNAAFDTRLSDAGRSLPGQHVRRSRPCVRSALLREAINLANVPPGNNTISFAPAMNGTITLTQGATEPQNTGGTQTINGPMTISGNNASRVFQIDSNVQAVLTALTIENGNAGNGSGGGVANNGGTLTVADATFIANSAYDGGQASTPVHAVAERFHPFGNSMAVMAAASTMPVR